MVCDMMKAEQRERGWTMKKVKWGLFLILLGFVFLIGGVPQRPRLVNSITTGKTAYLTVLVDERDTKDKERLEEKILKMCREDTFLGIKLKAEGKKAAEKYYIKVYIGKEALERGEAYLIIEEK